MAFDILNIICYYFSSGDLLAELGISFNMPPGVREDTIDTRGRRKNQATKYVYNQQTKKDVTDQILRHANEL